VQLSSPNRRSSVPGYGAGVGEQSGGVVQETVETEPERWLRLEGIDNVRDVGGLPLRDGRTTRFGELLRSANLRHVTEADVAHLVEEFGLGLVIDLRTAREIDRDGPTAVAAAGVETVALSFIPEDGEALPESSRTGGDMDPLLRSYLGYLVDRSENVVEAVRLLGRPDAGPALVHCAAGKDRTGVLIALVLDAVGVAREAVIADYALSAEHVEPMFRRWTTAAGLEMPADLTPHLPRAEVIATVLARLDAEHGDGGQGGGGQGGGAAAWLRANGLEDDVLERLRDRLTDL
jgi:protein-tyrosine phosphatase